MVLPFDVHVCAYTYYGMSKWIPSLPHLLPFIGFGSTCQDSTFYPSRTPRES